MRRWIVGWLLARDIRLADLGLGLLGAASVMGTCAVTLGIGGLGGGGATPSIDPGLGVPIAVTPVADGTPGAAGELKVAAPWRSPAEKARQAAQRQNDRQLPEPAPVASAEPPLPEAASPAAPAPAAEPASAADGDAAPLVPAASDPLAAATSEAAGAAPASDPGSPAAAPGEASGEAGGGAGPGDPLYERAVAFYRARLVAWFSSQFKVSGSGLAQDELARHRVRVEIQVSDDLTISGYRVLDATHPTFEDAARKTIDRLLRRPLPAPPENYPGAVQRRVVVTFTCSEDACD